jgi:copper chaperone CopZ
VIRALEAVEGVKEARVNFAEKKAEVFLDDPAVSVDRLCEVLRKSGFSATKEE